MVKVKIFGLTILIVVMFLIQPISSSNVKINQIKTSLTSDSNIAFIEKNIEILNSDPSKYQNGINRFGLYQGDNDSPFVSNNSYFLTLDMEGKILQSPLSRKGRNDFGNSEWINETTLMITYKNNPMFWTPETNATEFFSFTTNQHHDMVYNPNTKTFMVIEKYVDSVLNQTNQPELMIVDRLREYNHDGDVVWEWNATDYVTVNDYFDYYDVLNATSIKNYSGPDYPVKAKYQNTMHTNSVFWDFKEDKIYINMRRFNEFFKIDHKTGNLDWTAGWNGDFDLYDRKGDLVDHLWYTPHDVNYIGNNEFVMFDNGGDLSGFGNVTVLDTPEDQRSSILHIKVDEVNNRIDTVFRWTAPKDMYSFHWGSARKLDNGNYLGGFGAWYHANKKPPAVAYHEDYGGLAVEVTPEGEIVWEMRLPVKWGFFKFYRTSISSIETTTATPQSTSPSTTNSSTDNTPILGLSVTIIGILIFTNIHRKKNY